MTNSAIYSISIATRATLNMHSLNNEGGEGNQIQTRMVNIIGEDGRMHNVNAISGDMFKHIQAEHLHRLAVASGLPLSEGARGFNANRVNFDISTKAALFEALKGVQGDAAELEVILKQCAVTDLEGILVTADKRSLPRKSVVEFGWVVGVPEAVETDTYFHVKYVADRSSGARADAESESGREANIGQAIFHRPASSGIYALVLNMEIARIGFNDIAQTYAITTAERQARMKTLLESVMYTLVEPAGAMRSTQNPHVVNIAGVISISREIVPAPCISPLREDYVQQIQQVADSINTLRPGAISLLPFETMGEFAAQMVKLVQEGTPYTLQYNSGK